MMHSDGMQYPRSHVMPPPPHVSLDTIQFGLFSTKEVLRQSVCEILHARLSGPNSVYDERMGVLENSKHCGTCGLNNKECIGHFGHIQLNTPIVHPLFYKSVLNILRCVCYKCSKLVVSHDHLEFHGILRHHHQTRFYKLLKFVERIDVCCHCSTTQPKYHIAATDKTISMLFKIDGEQSRTVLYEYEILQIFRNIPSADVVSMGFDPDHSHPQHLIIECLPVLPPVARPYVISDTVTCDDDLTIQYMEIIKANINLARDYDEMKKAKCIQSLKFRIKCLFDNSQERSKHSNGRPLKGFKKRLTGKEGQLRNNLMGKRVDKSARTVIGPDPTLKVNEIAIPPHIASILTYPVMVNRYNIASLQASLYENRINYVIRKGTRNRINMKYALFTQGTRVRFGDIIVRDGRHHFIQNERQMFVLERGDRIIRNGKTIPDVIFPERKPFELQIGDTVERKLVDGDIVLLNRQPTLHTGSMQAFNVVIRQGKVIRMNLAVTKSFNADFDGDEMNIFCPGSVEAATELAVLSSVDNHIISNQSNKPNIVMVQDCVLGLYLMTAYDRPIPCSDFFRILDSISSPWSIASVRDKIGIMKTKGRGSGHASSSLDNVIEDDDQAYMTGRLLFSMLLPDDFDFLGDDDHHHVLIQQGVLCSGVLTKKHLGSTHRCILALLFNEYSSERCLQFLNDSQFMANAFLWYHGFSIGLQDCIISRESIDAIAISNHRLFAEAYLYESSIMNEAIREMHVSRILGNARDKGMKIAKDELGTRNKFVSTVVSGSKGDYFNIAQIMSLLGQQNFQGRRIKPSLNNGRRTLPHYPMHFDQHTPHHIRYQSQGFIENSFIHGLHPTEFWFHSITGREGITDTAMKTATSGYIQRRMVKVAEDVQVKYDGTVRNAVNTIVQFHYGVHGLEPTQCVVAGGREATSMQLCDLDRLVHKLNRKHAHPQQ